MKIVISCILFITVILIQGCAKPTPEESAQQLKEQTNRVITVQGQAEIKKGAKLLARNQAFRNAISNAAIEAGRLFTSNLYQTYR